MSTRPMKIEKNMCRCCLTEGDFKSLYASYFRMVNNDLEEFIYSNMLRECFGIELATATESSDRDCGICHTCVVRLRDAHDFKLQVLKCEEEYRGLYTLQTCKQEDPVPVEIKLENLDPIDDHGAIDIDTAMDNRDLTQVKEFKQECNDIKMSPSDEDYGTIMVPQYSCISTPRGTSHATRSPPSMVIITGDGGESVQQTDAATPSSSRGRRTLKARRRSRPIIDNRIEILLADSGNDDDDPEQFNSDDEDGLNHRLRGVWRLRHDFLARFGQPSAPVPASVPDSPLRLQPGNHYPVHTEQLPNKAEHKRLSCVRCKAQKKRCQVRLKCALCQAPLCVGKCWLDYHSRENLADASLE